MEIQSLLESLVNIFTLAQRPAPNPLQTRGFIPDLACLERLDGLCMQFQANPERPLDGGDSAHRTGVLAFCESDLDLHRRGSIYQSNRALGVLNILDRLELKRSQSLIW